MRFPHFLFREDPTISLLIVVFVCLFVLVFNSYRMRKISLRTAILCEAGLLLTAAALLIFL